MTREKNKLFKWITIAPPALYLLVMFLVPLSVLWVYSFSEKTGIVDISVTGTFDNYLRILDPLYGGIFVKSTIMAVLSTATCFIIGLILALCITFARSPRLQTAMLFLIVLPFWINMLIRVYALMVVFRRKGLINQSYQWAWERANALLDWFHLGHLKLLGEDFVPLDLLYNNTAVFLGLVYTHLPLMILPLFASLNKLDKSYLEASYDLGAGHFRTIMTVVIPMVKVGVVTGVIMTFIPMLGSFLVADLLGGKDSLLIANIIANQFKSANNWPFGAAMSFVLVYITLIAVAYKIYYNSKGKKDA